MPKLASKLTSDKMVPILLVFSLFLAFAVGILWEKVNTLGGGSKTAGTTQVPTTNPQQAAQQPGAVKVSMDQLRDLFNKDLITFGKADSKLVFVEVSDTSCPYCHIAAGKNPELSASADPGGRFKLKENGGTYVAPVIEMKKLVDQGKASLVFIYSPGHGNGEMGAKALYCAYEKGKFWEVHDLLMTNNGYNLLNNTVKNDKTKSQDLADFLKPAMSATDMKSCLDSGKYDEKVTSDPQLAASLGIQGTPGFFVNETNFAGAYSFTDMQSAVDAALK